MNTIVDTIGLEKCGHDDKWYVCKTESTRENQTHKIILNFEIKMG